MTKILTETVCPVKIISAQEYNESAKTLTTAIYALQAISFVFPITFLIAVIINHLKISNVQGTWLESHFLWQIRTFWYSLLWTIVGVITFTIFIGFFILLANIIWTIYRIAKGWITLTENREMY